MKKLIPVLFLLLIQLSVTAQNPLLIPPTLSGTNFTLNLQEDSVQFFPGQITSTYGVNGSILGPTLIFEADSTVNITVNNNLADTTTMHWHGMHVSPMNDGGPHTAILPGASWNPSFEVMEKAATFWYHPHLHKKTNKHVVKGMSGFIIVRDQEEAALNLPRTYGVDDIPLVLQTKAFDSINQIDVESHEDSIFMINATINPYFDAPAQVVRFRILNGSSNRTYLLGLTNNMSFNHIGTDGGLLAASVNLTRLRIAPGERVEILVDLNGMQGQTIHLVNYCLELPIGMYGTPYPAYNQVSTLPGYPNNPLNHINYNMLQINVVAPTASPITTVPNTLATVTPLLEMNSDRDRFIQFGVGNIGPQFLLGPFLFNGKSFDMDTINQYIPLNSTEIWTLSNNTQTSHPFHIHDVQFYILDIDGVQPAPSLQGRKDVVLVEPFEVIRFIAEFKDHENDTVPYMYHCHMLPHEDGGMMGQFIVSSNVVGTEEVATKTNLSIYPNPSSKKFTIELPENYHGSSSIKVFDQLGKLTYQASTTESHVIIYTEDWKNGIYYVQTSNNLQVSSQKVLIQN